MVSFPTVTPMIISQINLSIKDMGDKCFRWRLNFYNTCKGLSCFFLKIICNWIFFSNVSVEKCPNTEFLLVIIFLYSVQIQEYTDQKKKFSVFGEFSRSANTHQIRLHLGITNF